jgi:hypothetical protein
VAPPTLLIARLLALGALFNLLVAWSAALWGGTPGEPARTVAAAPRDVELWRSWRPAAFPPVPTHALHKRGPFVRRTCLTNIAAKDTAPEEGRAHRNDRDWVSRRQVRDGHLPRNPRQIYGLRLCEAGWPLPALRCCSWLDGDPVTVHHRGGFRLGRPWDRFLHAPATRGLPFCPLWGGLLANTAFYSLLLVPVDCWLRRRARSRRLIRSGFCPRCRLRLAGRFVGICPRCDRQWARYRRRWLLSPSWRAALVCAILGALLTAAVAWICASLVPEPVLFATRGLKDAETRRLDELVDRLVAGSKRRSAAWQTWGADRFGLRTRISRQKWFTPAEDLYPGPFPAAGTQQTSRLVVRRVEAGWPMLSMAGEAARMDEYQDRGLLTTTDWSYFWALDVSPEDASVGLNSRVVGGPLLPLRPVWPGVLFNTFFWACAAALVLRTPLVLLRRRRARRGHCAACGYNLRKSESAICPECGRRTGIPAVSGNRRRTLIPSPAEADGTDSSVRPQPWPGSAGRAPDPSESGIRSPERSRQPRR